jgi:hypothetical protein
MPVVVSGVTNVPSNKAYSSLKNEVARYVLRPDDSEALNVAGDGLNDAIRRLNTETWYWALVKQDISLVNGTATYSLSDAFRAPRNASLLNASNQECVRLSWMDPKTFEAVYQDARSAVGSPESYTAYNNYSDGLVTLYPTPDASSYPKVRIRYSQNLANFSGASDTLNAPSWVEGFIVSWAQAYMAAIYAPDKYDRAKRAAEEWWMHLRRTDQKQALTDWE